MESFRPVFAVKMAQNGFQYFFETTVMDSVKSPFEIQIARAYYDMEMRDVLHRACISGALECNGRSVVKISNANCPR